MNRWIPAALLAVVSIASVPAVLASDVGAGHWLLGSCVGLSLGVIHVPETGMFFQLSFKLRAAMTSFLVLITIIASTYPWYISRHVKGMFFMVVILPIVAGVYIMCIFKQHPPCVYAHDAKWCIFGTWLALVMAQMQWTSEAQESSALSCFAWSCSSSINNVVLCWMLMMFQARLSMLGLQPACRSGGWVAVFFAALNLLGMCKAFNYYQESTRFSLASSVVLSGIFLAIWGIYSLLVCVSLSRGIAILRRESSKVRGLLQQQAKWARGVLNLELLTCICVAVSAALPVLEINIFNYIILVNPEYVEIRPSWWYALGISRRVNGLVNVVALALLSGILYQGNPPEESDAEFESKSRTRGMASMADFLADDQRLTFQAKVEELALRGVHLASLLDFWQEMKLHPQSSTNDVVREAIIPRSRVAEGGKSLATIWQEDLVPCSLVTHHWNNRFTHLLAAIVADALQLDAYAQIAEELESEEGTAQLRKQLEQQGRLNVTYWVCAFSVNQHASICSGFGPEPAQGPEWHAWDSKRYNSVSGERYPLCSCHEPKVLSNRDPLCELNKFDEMMGYLSRRSTNFAQVLVVDKHFDVLYRAWCVAEIVEANVLGIPARIKVHSQNAVDCNYDRLAHLDVRNCSATSQEDKDLILQKIYDVDAFNLKLQQLVFSSGGLFSSWVDGRERSRQVGRIWRRSMCRSVETESGWSFWGPRDSSSSSELDSSDTESV